MFLRRVGSMLAARKKALQRIGGDACIAELPSGAGGRGEALDDIAVLLRALPNTFQRGRFSGPGDSLQSLYPVVGREHLFDGVPLRSIKLWASLGKRNGLLNGQELRSAALAVLHLLDDLFLSFDRLRRGELVSGI